MNENEEKNEPDFSGERAILIELAVLEPVTAEEKRLWKRCHGFEYQNKNDLKTF